MRPGYHPRVSARSAADHSGRDTGMDGGIPTPDRSAGSIGDTTTPRQPQMAR